MDGLSDVAEQIAELGTLRQKSMEVNAFQAENEDAMETLRQQHAAEIGIHRGRIQDLEQQLEARAYANELHQGEEGENADHVAQQLKDTQVFLQFSCASN